ncbi:MAG: excinuclease ABC subunit UvrC [Candidatus Pacearchaeota archaeon]
MEYEIKYSNLPNLPGCYIFKDKEGKILYIGKAKDLKKRVLSYFQKPLEEYDSKTKALIKNIDTIDFIVTESEKESLILENNLIKKHSPKYNINLKDSKRYAYLELTNEDFPRLLIARQKKEEGKYFGPFTSAEKRDYILETLTRIFKIRTCKKFPKKPCLRYSINLCEAPCIGNISKEKYSKKIKLVESVLKGKIKRIIKFLNEKMKKESKSQNFEKALEIRNVIQSLEYLKERQRVERQKKYNEDIINYVIKDNLVYLLLFNIYKGTLNNKQEFVFEKTEDFFEEFLLQYYSENPIPKEIILPHHIDESMKTYLSYKRGKKVKITVPDIGDKKILLDLVLKNIEIVFFSDTEKLEALKKELNLEETPRVIECFDVSHLSGTLQTGSMVQFRNGIPDKSNYRRFKIKSVNQIDDFAAIEEIVFRRYYRIKKEKLNLPNLIIIDGGRGQLNSALKALKKLNLNIPVISISKEFEEIYLPNINEPLKLEKKNIALQLIQKIRDEAHRFAIYYNKLLRKKSLFEKN